MPSTKVRRGLYWSERTQTWHYEFRFLGQKHNGTTGCTRERDARDYLMELKQALARGEAGLAVRVPGHTLRAAFHAWDERQTGVVVDAHRAAMRVAILQHCSEELDLQIEQLDTPTVEALRTRYMAAAGHSEGGANATLKLLSSLLGWCVRQGWLQARPFKLAPLKPQQEAKPVLWPEQVQAFLAEVDRGGRTWAWKKPDPRPMPHAATAVRMMVGLGMREDEALHARWEWIDWRRRVMVLTKTKNREAREVPIPDWLMEHLAALHPVTPTLGLVIPDHDEKGQPRPHTRLLTYKPVRRAGLALKIPDLSPHALRRTFATAHFEAGTPLSQIQQMLGHEDPETTMRYVLQRPKAQAAAQARVAKAMGFKSSPPLVPHKPVAKSPKAKQTKKKKSA